MSADEIESLSKLIATTDGKLSLKLLAKELEDKQPIIDIPKMTPERAKGIVESSLDHIKRYLAMNESNIVDIFREVEKDDGYLDRAELSMALSKIGFLTGGQEHDDRIDAFFCQFDPEKTLRVDYVEIIDALYKRANSKMVTDPVNKYFNIYQSIRNYMKQNRFLSLGSIFLAEHYLLDKPQLFTLVKQG